MGTLCPLYPKKITYWGQSEYKGLSLNIFIVKTLEHLSKAVKEPATRKLDSFRQITGDTSEMIKVNGFVIEQR